MKKEQLDKPSKIRILIVGSISWVIGVLIYIDPWYKTYKPNTVKRVTGFSKWDDFFLYGIVPIIIFWGILWIIRGYNQTKGKES